MTEIKSLQDLFYHEIQVLWSAEKNADRSDA